MSDTLIVEGSATVVEVGTPGPQGPNLVTGSTVTTLTGYLRGDGAAVSAVASVPAGDVDGLAAVATSGSASDLPTGTLPAARLPASGVTAGTYALPSLTVDAAGRVTAAGAAAGVTHASTGTHLLLTAQSGTDVPLAVRAATGQTAPLTEWRSPDNSTRWVWLSPVTVVGYDGVPTETAQLNFRANPGTDIWLRPKNGNGLEIGGGVGGAPTLYLNSRLRIGGGYTTSATDASLSLLPEGLCYTDNDGVNGMSIAPINDDPAHGGSGSSSWRLRARLGPGTFATALWITGSFAEFTVPLHLSSVPTSDPAVAGRVWNDGGTLKISAG